ncbi:unnamed protein product [Mytilus coruscus]|uniref:Uncharacterized protein n=1 Tax=Mytilus coruscus TaxID=42192 RepID=A0A6J8BXG4_MYTCO|nr:unnamed protein product [Mytilus coruscus]
MTIPMSKVTNLRLNFHHEPKDCNKIREYSIQRYEITTDKISRNFQQECIELDISGDDIAVISNSEKQLWNFYCPVSGCTISFLKHKSLKDHIIIGNCHFQSKCKSTSDTYKNLYALKVNQTVGTCLNLSLNAEETTNTNKLMKEWALKSIKAHVAFSIDQKKWCAEFFVPQHIASYFFRYS